MHTLAMSAIFNLLCLWHLLFAERWDVEMFPFSHGTLDTVKSQGSICKIYAIHTSHGKERVFRVYWSLSRRLLNFLDYLSVFFFLFKMQVITKIY